MSQYQQYDSVILNQPISLPDRTSVPAGTAGAVVEILNDGEAYLVELFGRWVKVAADGNLTETDPFDPDGFLQTLGVETVFPQQLCARPDLPQDLLARLITLPIEQLQAVQHFAEFLYHSHRAI
jgi:hypothetical protein